ncbi:MAG: response regulator transcription factor [Ferruginibacter sp.]|nr:response regulator transcription factor [Ferruginibacter sp.]
MQIFNTKVIIADDHSLFADGLEQILNGMAGFEVMAKVTNGKLLLQILNRLEPDLILLDINMPFLNGIDSAMAIKVKMPNVKIVFLSMYFDLKILALIKDNGFNGFIIKDTTAPLLKNVLLDIMKGKTSFLLPEQYVQKSQNSIHIKNDGFANAFKLSAREIEIIHLIKDGLHTKQIADDLHLSNHTIETHRKNIYRKLNLQGLGELISFASKNNL